MKRLVDESTDELTRSLLVAGIEHRPPPGNRRRVMLALGAGGAFGLFSSNAFAWLGTTAGKVTAASVVVGIAGAALVTVPLVQRNTASQMQENPASPSSEVRATLDGSHAAQPQPPGEPSAAEGSAPQGVAAAGPASSDIGEHAPPALGQEPAVPSDTVTPSPTPSLQEGVRVADSGGQKAHESQGTTARAASAGPAKARSRARKSGGRKNASSSQARNGEVTLAPNTSAGSSSGAAAGAGSVNRSAAGHPNLDAEVRLVDDMHAAVRRNDDEALARFVERYRLTFPDGQLKKEVTEFAARLSPSKTSESDGPPSDGAQTDRVEADRAGSEKGRPR